MICRLELCACIIRFIIKIERIVIPIQKRIILFFIVLSKGIDNNCSKISVSINKIRFSASICAID